MSRASRLLPPRYRPLRLFPSTTDFAITAEGSREAEVISSWQGVIIGVSVAAPVGPMAILCLRRSIMFGRSVGMATGMGMASAHALYSAVAMAGLHSVSAIMGTHSVVVRAASAVIMVGLGIRLAFASPSSEQGQLRQLSLGSAYASAFGLSLANPLMVLSLASLLATSDLSTVQTAPSVVMLVTGVFAGSSLWWLVMTRSATLFATHLMTRTITGLNRLTGPSLVAIAASITFR